VIESDALKMTSFLAVDRTISGRASCTALAILATIRLGIRQIGHHHRP
jgi:hypothetical protein